MIGKRATLLGLAVGGCLSAGTVLAQTCGYTGTVKFAGSDWASATFHTAVARTILEKGYGCKTESIPGSTQPLLNALARGDVHILMELWKANNEEIWGKMERTGRAVETKGVSIQGAIQGWWVPRYLVEGDSKRGIKAAAPGLKSVTDLPRYKHLFRDPVEPSKGRFYNCKLGWICERMNTKKLQAYKLTPYYTNFQSGSGAGLAAAIASAYRRGRPIFFYYWGPTWVLGKYDLVMLEEPPYNKTKWDALEQAKSGKGMAATAYPKIRVTIAANKRFADAAPSIISFLNRYLMTDAMVNKALVFMRENKDRTGRKTAMDFLKRNPGVWTRWVPAAVAARVKGAL